MTLRLRRSTTEAIAGSAKEQGLTMKQLICKALTEAGISVAAVDLEDRTPRRQS
jgi:predicted HicB family RNase H-like nuclease